MPKEINAEDIKNIITLIGEAPIKGANALGVAVLLQKLNAALTAEINTDVKSNNTK